MGYKIPVIVFFAPTAAGKTSLIQKLFGEKSCFAFKGKAEIISADSQTVYKGIDIGTAKPSLKEKDGLNYHLLDILLPSEQFDASDFKERADILCRDIYNRRNIPVVVGGAGFYIRAFLQGVPKTPQSDACLRDELKQRAKNEGIAPLYKELYEIDPISAKRINKNDAYRIIRALEVFKLSGTPLSSIEVPKTLRENYNFCILILDRDRDELYRRIDNRVEQMFRDGLAFEVQNLLKAGYSFDSPALKAIGYKEFNSIDNNFSEENINFVKEKIKLNSRHYAKKQYTYIKGIPNAIHVNAEDTEGIAKIVGDFFSLNGM